MEEAFLLSPGSFWRLANKLVSCSFVILFPSPSVGLSPLTWANNAADSSFVKDSTFPIEDSNLFMVSIETSFGFVSAAPEMPPPYSPFTMRPLNRKLSAF